MICFNKKFKISFVNLKAFFGLILHEFITLETKVLDITEKILKLKEKNQVTIVSHFYQKNEVFDLADITGDSLELAKKCMADKNPNIVFCGVGFMGQSVKVLSPQKRVFMPKVACCAMARMIDATYFLKMCVYLEGLGFKKEQLLPITYINSNADVKAEIAKMGGMCCTSSNARKIIDKALEQNKKIVFVPDRCLGQNIALDLGLKSAVVGLSSKEEVKAADIICYNGFCSVHQLFTSDDIDFFRQKYNDIKIIVHPECDPKVSQKADFVGSTAQLKTYLENLFEEDLVAVGTEYNFVQRIRQKNTFILSSTKPQCPTMNETTLQDLLSCLKDINQNSGFCEINLDETTSHWARIGLQRMLDIS